MTDQDIRDLKSISEWDGFDEEQLKLLRRAAVEITRLQAQVAFLLDKRDELHDAWMHAHCVNMWYLRRNKQRRNKP